MCFIKNIVLMLLLTRFSNSAMAGDYPMPDIPPPPGLINQIADENAHFAYMIEHVADDPEYFRYMKIRYFILPVIRKDDVPVIEPDPMKAVNDLRIYATALKLINSEFFDRLNEEYEYTPTLEELVSLRTWFRYMSALAYGERVVNQNGAQDGGTTYRELFQYTKWLKNDPEYFREVVADYCQIARRPFRAMRDQKITWADETLPLFLSEFLAMDITYDPEPNLSRLYPAALKIKTLEDAWEKVPDESKTRLPVLHRMATLIVGCARPYARNKQWGGFVADIKIALPILEECVAHPDFTALPEEKQKPITDLLIEIQNASF